MPDKPSAEFFKSLDETPQRRGGGRIVSVREVAESRSQLRGAAPQPARSPRFPELERRRSRLALISARIEADERDER
jgi:hypothetical protein